MKIWVAAIAGLALGFGAGLYGQQSFVSLFNPQLVGGPGDDYLVGTDYPDTVEGKGGIDMIEGGEGDDTLYGGEGDDQLHGDGGFDKLFGEEDSDRLWGGAGTDWFVFKGQAALVGTDRIEDFEFVDLIVLEKLGVTRYEPGRGTGTIFAQKASNGDVLLDVVTSTGNVFVLEIANPEDSVNPADFSNANFIFAN